MPANETTPPEGESNGGERPENERRALLLEIIEEHQEIEPMELYREFERRNEHEPISTRGVRYHLTKLAEAGRIEKVGTSKERFYMAVSQR